MRLSLAQLAQTQDPKVNLDRAAAMIRQAADQGANVVGFAELAALPFFPQRLPACAGPGSAARAANIEPEGARDEVAQTYAEPIPGPTTDLLCGLARELGVVIVFNLYERDARGWCFDSSPVIDADGRLLGVTRMLHIAEFDGFHEKAYYTSDDRAADWTGSPPVYETRAGRIGVAICYDRHFPEYMRALGVAGAELVIIPQANLVGEHPDGLFEAEVRTPAYQNGYFAALCNRAGQDGNLQFAGRSFVCDPNGQVIAQCRGDTEELLIVDCDKSLCERSAARRFFFGDRRPELYRAWLDRRVAGD